MAGPIQRVNVQGGSVVHLLVNWERTDLTYTAEPPGPNEIQVKIHFNKWDSLDNKPYEVGKNWAMFKIFCRAGSYEASLWTGSETTINATIGIFDQQSHLRLNASPASQLVRAGQKINLAAGVHAGGQFIGNTTATAVHERPLMSVRETLQKHEALINEISQQSGEGVVPKSINAQLLALQGKIGASQVIPCQKQGVVMNKELARGEEVHTAQIDTSGMKPGAHVINVYADGIDPQSGAPVTLTERITVVVY